jgi:hypothetical protein
VVYVHHGEGAKASVTVGVESGKGVTRFLLATRGVLEEELEHAYPCGKGKACVSAIRHFAVLLVGRTEISRRILSKSRGNARARGGGEQQTRAACLKRSAF